MTPFERGLIAHLVADWILQNDWMARNKTCLRHPAAWTHAAIHGLCLTLALGWVAGLVLGLVHLLIDTRVPVTFWMLSFVERGGQVVVCRRNVPLARIEPIRNPAPGKARRSVVGCLKGTVSIHGDLTEPCIPEADWEMLK